MRLTQHAAVVLALSAAMSVAVGQQARGADQSLAGRQASAATVQPLPTPPIPEGGAGIAAKYPGDVGIERDADVVFVESFEGSVNEICSRWEAAVGKPIMSKSDEVPPGSGFGWWTEPTRLVGRTSKAAAFEPTLQTNSFAGENLEIGSRLLSSDVCPGAVCRALLPG